MALDFWLALTSSLGIAILAVPAFSLNFRKKSLARIMRILERRRRGDEKRALDAIAEELEAEAAFRAATWRRVDEICLFVGYVLLLGSSAARVLWLGIAPT